MNEYFTTEDIPLRDDYEGSVKAVMISYTPSLHHKRAVLYIHGFIDYFFQEHLAEFYEKNGFAFYALDLRKYGRSILPHQLPNFALSFTEYYEETAFAVNRIKEKHDFLLLNAHSAGTLTGVLFCREHPDGKKIDALFLNSPFYAFPYPELIKRLLLPSLRFLGLYYPYKKIPARFSKNYGYSLHKEHNGEWDFDLDLKPVRSFPVYAGWILAVYRAQKRMRRKSALTIPVLVMHSDKSISKYSGWIDDLHRADAVLNVKDMRKYAPNLGENIKQVEIKDAKHDVFLSVKAVREKAFDELKTWLKTLSQLKPEGEKV